MLPIITQLILWYSPYFIFFLEPFGKTHFSLGRKKFERQQKKFNLAKDRVWVNMCE